MIKIVNIISLLLILTMTVQAQEGRSREERVKAIKVAFITEELQLTTEQSAQFWPIYNEFQSKLKALRKSARNRIDEDTMSDQELEAWLEGHLKKEEEKAALHRAYVEKFKQVISVRQIVKLSKAERQFKRKLLERAKERREGGGGRRG